MSYVYELVSENLSNLGSSMGTESTSENWRGLFSDKTKAKAYAEKDYLKQAGPKQPPIKWRREGRGYTSQDLGFVMYTIQLKRVL